MIFLSFLKKNLNHLPAKVICLALAIAIYGLFRVNTLAERLVSVPLRVLNAEGFVVSSEYTQNININLRGDKDYIDSILPEDIEARVDLRPFPEEGEFQLAIELHKKNSALQSGALELRPHPKEIILSQERRVVRSIVVQENLTSFPAFGYELSQYFLSPSSVTAVGPQSQMLDLKELRTEIIDLSGRMEDFTVTVRLIHPSDHITIPGGDVVEFRGIIEESVVIQTLQDIEVVILDLPENLKIAQALPTVNITIQGSQLIMEKALTEGLNFYIEGRAIQELGSYTLPLKMDIPPGLLVLQLSPREVNIDVISSRE